MSNFPYVIIVIFDWNERDDTLECLDSALRIAYANFKLVEIDNGSADDLMQVIPWRYPANHIILLRLRDYSMGSFDICPFPVHHSRKQSEKLTLLG